MLNEFVKEALPTPLSRWVAVGTASIAGICIVPPEWLQKIAPAAKAIESPEIRLPLFLTILFLGTFIVLVAVLFHVRELNGIIAKKAGKPTVDVRKRLDPEREKVLTEFIANERLYESQLERLLSMNKNRVIFHLNDLTATKMTHEYYDQERFWVLEQEGRRYLDLHGLLP